MESIEHAPQNWQRRWFATPQHRRDRIEEHMEHCRVELTRLQQLDITDSDQHELWKAIIKNSPYSLRHCGRLIDLQNNTINQYLSGIRRPKGGRTTLMMSALLWNITTDRYHLHLLEMMWATYWADQNEDAPKDVNADVGFERWAKELSNHPLYQDLPHGIAQDPAVNIYAESGS